MKGKFGLVGRMDKWKKGDLPANQMVNIFLNHYGTNSDGKILLTCQLASDAEVDHEIDNLIKELESVRKKAKLKINSTNAKIKESITNA